MQPTYFPWLGFFDLIRQADVFVVYDSVQFEKQSWQQRNRIRTKSGELLLTLPVHYGTGLERLIHEVQIDYSRNVPRKHLSTIQQSYSKAVCFKSLFPELEAIFQRKPLTLVQMNMAIIEWGMRIFKLDVKIEYASNLNIQGSKVQALIDICQQVGADRYLSPLGSKVYIDEDNLFPESKIDLVYQNFEHPVYQQMTYPDFISHLSFLDYIFNVENPHKLFEI